MDLQLPRPLPRGFTMLELLLIVAMLALLAGIGGTMATAGGDQAMRHQASQAVDQVVSAQLTFANKYGTFTGAPDDLDLPEGPEVTTGPSTSVRSVSVAMSEDGVVGVAAGDGRGLCALKRVTSPLAGAQTSSRTISEAGEGCTGAAALGSGATLAPDTSRLP